ncbi:MAG: FAD-dependent oxidoreductase [Candidatus Helarchaeota archaeon]
MKELECDVLVVGAGVAGLCAAIAAARNNLTTILIEKNSEIGSVIKGENINKKSPIFEKIFSKEKAVPKVAILNELTGRRIYSPSAKKYIEMQHSDPSIAIDYRLFIVEIFKELSKTNCKVMLNTTLMDLIKKNDIIIGANCESRGERIKIKSKFIIAADGNHSKIGKKLNIRQNHIYHSLKFNYENLHIPNPSHIELYLMTNPAGALWMFPKGKTSGEAGITIWTHELPADFDILKLWEKKSMENSRVREIIKDAKCFYISKDFLNFGGPIKNIFGNGVAFVGDSGGHVGAIGAAGIISSMTAGYEVSNFICQAVLTEGNITESMTKEFSRKFKKSEIGKKLKKEQSAGITLRNVLFDQFKTAEVIDENWDRLKQIMLSQSENF